MSYPLSRLPVVSGATVVKALQRLGWVVNRQKGSHVIMDHAITQGHVTIPQHDALAKPTLKSILMEAEVSLDDFLEVLQ